jgi:hypothetical protein
MAKDGQDSVDIFGTIVSVEFGVSKPSKPVKETSLKAGVTYKYESLIIILGGYCNYILYKFSWGDVKETKWLNLTNASHIWTRTGAYQIKVKALLTLKSTGDDAAEDI